jgi:type III restriction enzyme
MELEGIAPRPDIAAVVAKTTELVNQQTISIPRILVVPKGEVRSGFKAFKLELGTLNYPAPSEELWIQYLRTNQLEVLGLGKGGIEEARIEDYIVSGLVDFDDVAYDEHADLLYDFAAQVINHFRSYLSEDDTKKVLRLHQRDVARFIHSQMQNHYWEEAMGYEVRINKGFTELKPSAYTASKEEPPLDFHQSPDDKSNMAKYLFGGFNRCLYPVQKFQSDSERKLAVILDRESMKWFKPARDQFQIYYRWGGEHLGYQPDFVAEEDEAVYMLEAKARTEMDSAEVLAKKEVALRWCKQASDHAQTHGGKPWQYVLIPHDAISENMTIAGFASQFAAS